MKWRCDRDVIEMWSRCEECWVLCTHRSSSLSFWIGFWFFGFFSPILKFEKKTKHLWSLKKTKDNDCGLHSPYHRLTKTDTGGLSEKRTAHIFVITLNHFSELTHLNNLSHSSKIYVGKSSFTNAFNLVFSRSCTIWLVVSQCRLPHIWFCNFRNVAKGILSNIYIVDT